MDPNFPSNGERYPRDLRFRRTCFDRPFGETEFRSTSRSLSTPIPVVSRFSLLEWIDSITGTRCIHSGETDCIS